MEKDKEVPPRFLPCKRPSEPAALSDSSFSYTPSVYERHVHLLASPVGDVSSISL